MLIMPRLGLLFLKDAYVANNKFNERSQITSTNNGANNKT